MIKVAILVDGAFYLKRAAYLWGNKNPKERADELIRYCHRHLKNEQQSNIEQQSHDFSTQKYLYRIFYYDCEPSSKKVYHPLLKKQIDLSKTEQYSWSHEFLNELRSKRKLAFRKGELLESSGGYTLRPDVVKKLCNGAITVSDLKEQDFVLDIKQKGVDMKIGLDIASLSYKKQVDQIILIAGDSDFVPAAKHARREGIDFILDPMWHTIKPSLNEHIDGLITKVSKEERKRESKDPLYKKTCLLIEE